MDHLELLGIRRSKFSLAHVAVNAVKQKIMCIVLLCCSCCALFNEAAAGSIYMTYLQCMPVWKALMEWREERWDNAHDVLTS
jgi:hypothetical protein